MGKERTGKQGWGHVLHAAYGVGYGRIAYIPQRRRARAGGRAAQQV